MSTSPRGAAAAVPRTAHDRPVARLLAEFETDAGDGLDSETAAARLAGYGANELREQPRPGWLRRLAAQFRGFLMLLLIAAAVVSLLLGELLDTAAILAIVTLNAVLGLIQETRAERALAALQRLSAPAAMVVRDGRRRSVPARELVPGDVVLLEAGNFVPADIRLLEAASLSIDEAAITGESLPATKDAGATVEPGAALGDRRNLAFMGTVVVRGRGRGLVVGTGMSTEVGQIAELLESYEQEPTPLQRKLDQLGRWLGLASLAICGVIFVFGVLRDTRPLDIAQQGLPAYLAASQAELVGLFMTAVSLAIAAVPEGLPAVVTICLALGTQRMVRRHALLRRLPAVETLGCATVICSDKTGTLTQNQMTVREGWVAPLAPGAAGDFGVTGEGYAPHGSVGEAEREAEGAGAARALLLCGAVACNDARLEHDGDAPAATAGRGRWWVAGDPTEGALLVAAAKAGLWSTDVARALPRLAEVPFDSARKRMTTVHRVSGGAAGAAGAGPDTAPPPPALRAALDLLGGARAVAFVKGAADVLLERCDTLQVGSACRPLEAAARQQIAGVAGEMGRRALRVLGVAYRPLPSAEPAAVPESGLTFLGLLAMRDPPRPEVREAVAQARAAGLRTVMITGDHGDTAVAVAGEIGLFPTGTRVLAGTALDALDPPALAAAVDEVDAYVRVSPHHKVRIVEALKAQGHVVAMTGDGVNDAPALKRANIGVAMGLAGTDVARETADVVLTDDNYASIVAAVEEGRTIYANIRTFVYYLISCNVGEILVVLLAMLAGLPLPLRPIQLLWLNLVTDGAPALALAMERGDPDVMRRPPRPVGEPLIDRTMRLGIAVQAVVTTAAVLGAYWWALRRFPDSVPAAQTVAFATLVLSELLRAYTARSERLTVLALGVWTNRWMVLATASSLTLLLVAIYVPFLRLLFTTVPLGALDWLLLLPFALAASVAAEVTKLWRRQR